MTDLHHPEPAARLVFIKAFAYCPQMKPLLLPYCGCEAQCYLKLYDCGLQASIYPSVKWGTKRTHPSRILPEHRYP